MSNLAPVHQAARAADAIAPTAAAISEWPDVDDLQRRFAELVSQPMRPIQPHHMHQVMGWFDERCTRSRRSMS